MAAVARHGESTRRAALYVRVSTADAGGLSRTSYSRSRRPLERLA